MTLKYSLSAGNSKTGAMLLVRSPRSTCPDSCGLKDNGCYAYNFPTVLHWVKQDTIGVDFATVLYAIRTLPKGTIWRLFEAGDFEPSPENPEIISPSQVVSLLSANKGKRGFGYTHYPVLPNLEALQLMNASGLTINASADNFEQAKLYFSLGLPTVLVVAKDHPKDKVVDGLRVVVCPNQSVRSSNGQRPQCVDCQLCQIADRDYIIGFRAHGTKAKKIKVSQI